MSESESGRQAAVSAAAVGEYLRHLHRCGVSFLPKSDVKPAAAEQAPPAARPAGAPQTLRATPGSRSATAAPPPAVSASGSALVGGKNGPSEYPGPVLSPADRAAKLAELAEQVRGCVRCELLARTRRNTVFGEGSPTARVCFFGEAPGADEDAKGRPFVGRSGELLTKMIEACSWKREDVYILNTIKCRPPGNRNPEPTEILHCRPYFEQQLETIRPDYIVCLGLVATQALLGPAPSIGRMRGRFHRYLGSKVVVTYHPSYLLRNPSAKREAWADLKLLLADMGITPG